MGTKNNPGKFDCYSKADPDEPVFVLLGRDPIASFCVTLWAELNRAVNAAEPHCAEKSAEALACSSAMHEYACARGADEDVQRVADAFFSLIGVREFAAAAVGRDAVRDLVPKFNPEKKVVEEEPHETPGALVEAAARAAHEVNRAYCHALGDESQPQWYEAPDWQKDSARAGARMHIESDVSPEDSHAAWMAQKLGEGWKYGPVKDPDKKEHPCMVPFAELPPEQRAKDHLFRAVVTQVAWAFAEGSFWTPSAGRASRP